jgi:hypothetical protein
MVVDSRDRVTVDLCGLGPAVKSAAAARNLTLAAFAARGHRRVAEGSRGPIRLFELEPRRRRPAGQDHADPAASPGQLAGGTCTGLRCVLWSVPRVGDRRCALSGRPSRRGQRAHGVDRPVGGRVYGFRGLSWTDPPREIRRSREIPRGGRLVFRRDPEAHEVDFGLGRRGAKVRQAPADGGKSVLRKERRA